MKVKIWLVSWLIIVITALSVFGYWVYKVDPFFHYHKPDLNRYFYVLNNQRSQNDGISKHFDYDALITGTSMAENFRTTEADDIFGVNSIKVAFSGGTFKEIDDNINRALSSNKNITTVIRCLDMAKFLVPADEMRTDLGKYPEYLYDNNPFNDVEYLFNRDIIFGKVYQMTLDNNKEGFEPGITSFDEYSRWQNPTVVFGINNVCPDGIIKNEADQSHLSDEEKEMIRNNIARNVTDTADKYPDVDFYYFYSPYSVVVWNNWNEEGTLIKHLEAEAYVTELIVSHENIHLFSFNNRTDIISDLNNYKDASHYGSWINSLILKWMHDGQYQLTEYNYKDYLSQEYDYFTTFDYSGLNGQKDYEADYYAAALLNEELTGVKPLNVLTDSRVILSVSRETGIKFTVDLDNGYNYLSFSGKKIKDQGNLTAYVYDSRGTVISKIEKDHSELDNESHDYVIDLSAAKGNITVILNGGCIDLTGNADSDYLFSNIYMY